MAAAGDSSPEQTAGAEAAFASFLARVKAGEKVDFGEYCQARPDLADSLRVLHSAWKEQQAGSGRVRSIREFLSEKLGPDADPGISLEPDDQDDSDSGMRARMRELSARTGRYTLRGEVARGGMGVILKVWDRDLRRVLAMKAAFGGVPDDAPSAESEFVARFLEEAQITGQLDHPGVVPVHELGVDSEGRMFFTMRLVKGRTLDEVMKLARRDEGEWNRVRALNVIIRVCEALAYAHSKGVIHRDIKPANIMVGKFGEVYVMDWGLAKVIGRPDRHDRQLAPDVSLMRTQVRTDRIDQATSADQSPLMTMEGTIIGTPTYMPPEQAEGRIDELDPRSDVYSVGALLYTLFTGWMPYVDPDRPVPAGTVLNLLIGGPPKPIVEIDHGVPPELVAICEKAMARRPTDRYASMLELADDLRAFVERRVVQAYETGAVAEFRKWVVRNKAMAAAVAAILVLAIGGAMLVAWLEKGKLEDVSAAQAQTEKARARAEKNAARALANAETASANAERAERQSYLASLAAAHASLRMHETREAELLLEACPERYRGWEWRHLRLLADTSLRVFRGHTDKVAAVAFSPDGRRIASGSDDRSVRIWNAGTGELLFSLPGSTDPVTAIAYSPDGRRVAAASRDMLVRIWDAQAGRLVGTLAGHESVIGCLAFSPDGTRIATGADEGATIWDAATFQQVRTIEHDDPVNAVAIGPDSRRLATGTDAGVHVWDLETGEAGPAVELDEPASSVAFDAAGTRVLAGSLDGSVYLMDPAAGTPHDVLAGHTDPVAAAVFDPSGKFVASASYDKTVRVWDLERGGEPLILQGHAGPVLDVAWERAGERIVSGGADGSLRLWTRQASRAVATLRGDEDFLSAVAFTADGKSVAAASAGHGEIRFWDSATGAAGRTIPESDGGLSSLAISGDGRWLAAGGEQDATVRIHDAATGARVHTLRGHEASVSCVAFSPGGGIVATGSADESVRLWDRERGDEVVVLRDHGHRVASVAFSPDGSRLAAAAGPAIRIWSAADGALERTLESGAGLLLAVAFSPDGAWLVAGGTDQTIRFWDAETGEAGPVLSGHAGPVTSLGFSTDGTRLASGSQDKTVRIWDAATGDALLRLSAHHGWVTSVAFSPDGSRLASSSFDTTVRVWHTR